MPRHRRSTRTNFIERQSGFLTNLPDDILLCIIYNCDITTLGRLTKTCKKLRELCRRDCVWLRLKNQAKFLVNSKNKCDGRNISVKDQYRVSRNWTNGSRGKSSLAVSFPVKQLPWLQQNDQWVYLSNQERIECYKRGGNGTLCRRYEISCNEESDVSRFKVKHATVVSANRSGSLYAHTLTSGMTQQIGARTSCHSSDIHDVDFHGNTVVSGSRDNTVKVWSLTGEPSTMDDRYTKEVGDRVWSVALSPDGSCFMAGTAGVLTEYPLQMYDTESGRLAATLGGGYRTGAGVLDMSFTSPHILFSCGHDTYIRMWDLRASTRQCVNQWEEPYDLGVYTVEPDSGNMLVCGTSQHGKVDVFDIRHSSLVTHYYMSARSCDNSPVYSLCYDLQCLYVALDRGVRWLDFSREINLT